MTLDNGLTVLLAPRTAAPAVAVSVHYDVGFRSEPEGRGGFAHLFEHLMFQGSARHPKLHHWRYVQGLGGVVNGSTHQDYTDYYQVLPREGLARVLAMEADRMAALLISEENLDNQRTVVQEEIRLNILNRAYGGFPWIPLPALLYRTYPNAHNGYGDFEDLEAATVEEADAFYRTYYVPSNAVLTVGGDFDVDRTLALVDDCFGGLPRRPKPQLPALREPPPRYTVDADREDRHAPMPALALGYQLPDAVTKPDDYLAHMVLWETLAGGTASPLYTRLVRDRNLAVGLSGGCGLFGPLDARAPDTLAMVVTYHRDADPDAVLTEVDRELARLGEPHTARDLAPLARRRLAARTGRRTADLLAHTRALGTCQLLHGRAALVDELPERVEAVPADAVARVARQLLTSTRAVLRLTPAPAPLAAGQPATRTAPTP
ncbi:M16 family metallopeptidase [Streptomyces sp. NPDC127098]|uniref:M16 family metallopeptidase n=1 Tax=Streptomyces sp. NPDC127098 TaxID=3347137 RepID=UPI00364DA198